MKNSTLQSVGADPNGCQKMGGDTLSKNRSVNCPKSHKSRTRNLFFLAGGLVVVLFSLLLTNCDKPVDKQKQGTLRYTCVSYKNETRANGEEYEIMHTAFDENSYYYVLCIGHIENVPILYREPVTWEGKSTSMTYGYSKSNTTEEQISRAITEAESNSVTKDQECNYGITASASFGGELKVANWKASVGISVGGATTWGKNNTRSKESTVSTAYSKSESMTDSYDIELTSKDAVGKYRWTLFGTADVYLILKTNKTKTKIEDSYSSYLVRRETYAWSTDYEPDIKNGSFEKTSPSELLTFPKIDLASLPTPTDDISTINLCAQPTASPVGNGKEYDKDIDVYLYSSTAGAQIYYTTNGVDPSMSNRILYDPAKPISVLATSGETTIKAITTKDRFYDSKIMTETYRFTKPRSDEGVMSIPFNVSIAGGAELVRISGDNFITTTADGRTYTWSLKITITGYSSNIAQISYVFSIQEDVTDYTHYILTKTEYVDLGEEDIKILEPSIYNKSGKLSGALFGDINMGNVCEGIVKDFTMVINQNKTKDPDDKNVKASGTLVINFSFQPKWK